MELYSEDRKGDFGKRESMKTFDKGPRLDSNQEFRDHRSRITVQPRQSKTMAQIKGNGPGSGIAN